MTYAILVSRRARTQGEMFQNWNYDLYGQFGKVLYEGVYRNDFSKSRILKAMDVIIARRPASRLAARR